MTITINGRAFNVNDNSPERGLAIQEEQLKEWRRKLNAECYSDLVTWLGQENLKLGKDATLYSVTRGQAMTMFICNWFPKD
jgi:hypothetical protein